MGVDRRVKTASASPSRTAAAATDSSRVSGSGVMRRASLAGCWSTRSRGQPLSQGADGGGHALARGGGGDAEPVGDPVVVEVLDEAEVQGSLGPVGERRDQRVELAVLIAVIRRRLRHLLRRELPAAGAVVVDRRGGGDAVEPRAQVVGVAQ